MVFIFVYDMVSIIVYDMVSIIIYVNKSKRTSKVKLPLSHNHLTVTKVQEYNRFLEFIRIEFEELSVQRLH